MKLFSAFIALLMLSSPTLAQVETGKLAPNFTGTDMDGKSVSLEDYRGKTVVLEWNNPECPFVVKHYQSENMQKLQKQATAQDVVWLTINSGAEGKQGHMTAEKAQANFKEKGLASTHYILDSSGEIGRQYGAKTTPHMFVVDPEGLLVYQGAIDSVASFDSNDIASATNYVSDAIAFIKENKAVEVAETQPYGCAVKYAD